MKSRQQLFIDPDVLVENIIIWFGYEIDQATFNDYLRTYIETSKPDDVSSLIYRLFHQRSKTREFESMVASKGIKVSP